MEHEDPIPADIKRFILRSIDSVPHLEAILLFQSNPQNEWDAKMIAQRIYIPEKKAADILTALHMSGFISALPGHPPSYQYRTSSLELENLVTEVAKIYSRHLIEVTNLIHSKIDKQAQQLGDAFKWQQDKE